MSRSIKKHGWITDGANRAKSGPHYYKQKANKRVRRTQGDIPNGKFYRKLSNPWDIHDFIVEAREKGSEPDAYKDWIK